MKHIKNQIDINNTVFIIDASYFLFRAYYGMRPLRTHDNKAVHAVYGFCAMLKNIIDTFSLRYVVLVWDSKGKTIRHRLYDHYKAHRNSIPNDFSYQKELAEHFADLVGIAQIATPGVEADDLIYSLAHVLARNNHKVVLVTADKDLLQTLNESIIIFDPFKEIFVTRESLEQSLLFSVDKLVFYYALIGDRSDNIPGVKGIGPKRAQELLKKFDSLADLYTHLEKIDDPKIKALLQKSQSNAFLSEQLFKLNDLPVSLSKEKCKFNREDWAHADAFFEKLGFQSLRLPTQDNSKSEVALPAEDNSKSEVALHTKYNFILVDSINLLNTICNQIKHAKRIALDTEGTSINPLQGRMVGLSLCIEEGVSYYIPFGHLKGEQLTKKQVFSYLRPVLEDATIKKILHNAKFDYLMFHAAGINLQGIVFDTLIAASLLTREGQSIGLKQLSWSLFNEKMLAFEDVVHKQGYRNFSEVPLIAATHYAAADAHQTLRLYRKFEQDLEKLHLNKLFYTIEMPLVILLAQMEKAGIFLDRNTITSINNKVTQALEHTIAQIKLLLAPDYSDINLNSYKQIEELLFTYLKLPSGKVTKKKSSFSTDSEVLRVLSPLHPIPALILKYRELIKLKTSYTESLVKYINKNTGRIHTTFDQARVRTGRLASLSPNLQNIPVDNFTIRSAFKPINDHVFIAVDYSQIELKVLAYLSQDKNLLEAFNANKDIHALTASGIFNVPVEQINKEQRQIGKVINFGIIYGLTPHGLSKDLAISLNAAKIYIDQYMAQYPEVQQWMDNTIKSTQEKGYAETLFGRRRYIPEIYEHNKALYALGCRLSINTTVQGTASEIMKLGMVKLQEAFDKHKLKAQMLVQIHDELLLQVPKSEIEHTKSLIKQLLETSVNVNIPLTVSVKIGNNWQEVTK